MAPGRLTGSISREIPGQAGWSRYGVLVDVDNATVHELGEGLTPALRWWGAPTWQPQAGSPGSTLMLTQKDALVRLDPATGTVEPVLARSGG